MPRYFFHIHGGHSVLDDVGLDLPDILAARTTAIELSGEILKHDVTEPFLRHLRWHVEISDSPEPGGQSLFVLQFSIAV
ncbi:hypothetical protein ABIF38_001340 [Bradyrhizobium japonicum]|jgi:hypothetical protein|uniref:DUF6894 domain-containing protein n=1 Tax=Bradyrhizobium elkanii TaxID=29448 RepID=A0A1E3EJ73_BRAEL|nr:MULTISPECIES: hypothetical protein [Bradyrhizobium]MBP1291999.1 hypothetical protein [Bradyrhizobium elkanii]MBP2430318.1 hypothetical protein [Bradyrhizobium elkanii]MBR1160930.1 hypothetical protein [Bradyrhizobium elkanii]MCP1736342.1 hypothetical protein [Bradyrhizobium elkanii]MCP1754238.1 hypothetical protein [Bradyrhizobium elkanii]